MPEAEGVQDVDAYNASALVDLKFYDSNGLCWFDLRPNSSAGYGDNSPNFQILSEQRATSTTLGLAQPYAAATSSGGGATGTSGTRPTDTADTGDRGLSVGAKAGIGIGVALGVIGIACLAAAVWYHRRRGKEQGRVREETNAEKESDKYPVFGAGSDGFGGRSGNHSPEYGRAELAHNSPQWGHAIPGGTVTGFSEMPVEQASAELPAREGHQGYGPAHELANAVGQYPEPHHEQKSLANGGLAPEPR